MTGLEFKNSLLIKLAEVGTGFYDAVRLNDIVTTANVNMVNDRIKQFQSTQIITEDISPLITVTSAITPTNATIDISISSTDVVDYFRFINILITAPYRGVSISEYAKERKFGTFQSPYSSGDARYPKYYFLAELIKVEPADATAVVLTYFHNPITIDLADNTDQIPYNNNLIEALIARCMIEAGVDSRDPAAVQLGQMKESMNP